jgi:hypothetical protein
MATVPPQGQAPIRLGRAGWVAGQNPTPMNFEGDCDSATEPNALLSLVERIRLFDQLAQIALHEIPSGGGIQLF